MLIISASAAAEGAGTAEPNTGEIKRKFEAAVADDDHDDEDENEPESNDEGGEAIDGTNEVVDIDVDD